MFKITRNDGDAKRYIYMYEGIYDRVILGGSPHHQPAHRVLALDLHHQTLALALVLCLHYYHYNVEELFPQKIDFLLL